MSIHSEVEREVLLRIKPKIEEYEKLLSVYKLIENTILEVLVEKGFKAEVALQGSVAHDTWLSGDRDLDVFVLFPGTWSREELESKGFPILLEAASRIGKWELRYAEHPYVHVKVGDVEVDIVPGLRLEDPSQAKTAVDRTPFHTLYVNSKLTSEMRDQVRLLKKFMKSIGVYGAEVRVRGFSGYAAELLIIVYGSFRSVLEAASEWKPPVFINTIGEKFTGNLAKRLREKYPDSVIFMPDPVDPLRNVTAAVSLRSLATLILASTCYLRNPGLEFFEELEEPRLVDLLEALKSRCIVILEYDLREKLAPDVIWGEALRVSSRLESLLRVFGFRVIDYSAWTNEADRVLISAELEYCELPLYKHYKGPCIAHEWSRIVSFIEKHYGKGFGPWLTNEGCLESLDRRVEESVISILESRWSEFTVSPHLRNVKPTIMFLSEDLVKKLLEEGAGKWLWNILVKTPRWMAKCTS
jgi:tRNA nucleotidyltransferase (CCA-adding enzyme)